MPRDQSVTASRTEVPAMQPTQRFQRFAPALLIALVLTACGTAGGEVPSSEEPANGGAAASETSDGASASSEDAGGDAVTIKAIAYDPESLTVATGTEVTWTNEDANVAHTITSGSPGESAPPGSTDDDVAAETDGLFSGEVGDAGDTFSFTFDEAGTYAYFCEIHPSMIGEIVAE